MSQPNKPHIVILTGAGISKAAGIPTFEEAYSRVNKAYEASLSTAKPMTVDEHTALLNEAARDLVTTLLCDMPEPTDLHKTIAGLQEEGYDIRVYTTNVDTLHEDAGTQDVVHIHGTLEDPVYFGMTPRNVWLLEKSLERADAVVVIGTRLLFEYIHEPVLKAAVFKQSLLLDPDESHPFKRSFNIRHHNPQYFVNVLRHFITKDIVR